MSSPDPLLREFFHQTDRSNAYPQPILPLTHTRHNLSRHPADHNQHHCHHLYGQPHSSTGCLPVEADGSANVFSRVNILLCRPRVEQYMYQCKCISWKDLYRWQICHKIHNTASSASIDASNHLIKSWPLGETSYLFELSKAFSPLVVSDTIRGDKCYFVYRSNCLAILCQDGPKL